MINKDTKMIRIPSRGRVITSRGYMNTPIVKPYRESLQNIFRMLTSKPKPTILEVLPSGRTVELDLSNFDKDNTLVKPEISAGPVVPSVNSADSKPEEVGVSEEAPKEEVPVETPSVSPEEVNSADSKTEEVSVNEEVPKEENSTNNNYQSNRHRNKNKNKNKNVNNDRQQTQENPSTDNVEVVPEEVE